MDDPDIIAQLKNEELLPGTEIECKALSGGVSSDLWIVSDGKNRLIVKRARNKLMVNDDWYADTDRNRVEREFAEYIHRILPGSVPVVLHFDDQLSYYAMEYLGESFQNWKSLLMNGNFESHTAVQAAELLIQLHNISRNDPKASDAFSSKQYFNSLRIEPYFITTGERHPKLKNIFRDEANRLLSSKEVLVHGDFSPKNMMTGQGKVVLLDHEVAHFGDSAFDLAFLINHLLLKKLYHNIKIDNIPELAGVVWNQYCAKSEFGKSDDFDKRAAKLLLLLMLARVDGKSPVEYLNEIQRGFVRNFVYSLLEKEAFQVVEIIKEWNCQIKKRLIENQ
jgi:aminoglycoside phosphotransferase (APT) family kinase protein